MVLAVQADGSTLTTIEGIANGELHPVQEGFWERHGLQCGFCTPGGRAARGQFRPDRRRDPPRDRGQPVPLHRLPQHRAGDPVRRSQDAR
jgi:hypothetical protein